MDKLNDLYGHEIQEGEWFLRIEDVVGGARLRWYQLKEYKADGRVTVHEHEMHYPTTYHYPGTIKYEHQCLTPKDKMQTIKRPTRLLFQSMELIQPLLDAAPTPTASEIPNL